MVAHSYIASTWEAEAGRSQVQEQSELHSTAVSKYINNVKLLKEIYMHIGNLMNTIICSGINIIVNGSLPHCSISSPRAKSVLGLFCAVPWNSAKVAHNLQRLSK